MIFWKDSWCLNIRITEKFIRVASKAKTTRAVQGSWRLKDTRLWCLSFWPKFSSNVRFVSSLVVSLVPATGGSAAAWFQCQNLETDLTGKRKSSMIFSTGYSEDSMSEFCIYHVRQVCLVEISVSFLRVSFSCLLERSLVISTFASFFSERFFWWFLFWVPFSESFHFFLERLDSFQRGFHFFSESYAGPWWFAYLELARISMQHTVSQATLRKEALAYKTVSSQKEYPQKGNS